MVWRAKLTMTLTDCISLSSTPGGTLESCFHMPPDRGFQRAKGLLLEHYGDEFKLRASYMEKAFTWPDIEPEDPKALQAYALFLRNCHNAMEDMDMDMASNLRILTLKLPYKLRERWRSFVCDLQDHKQKTSEVNQFKRRHKLIDLVQFVEKQVRIASDPVFGTLQDHSAERDKTKPVNKGFKPKSSWSSFATIVSSVSIGSAQPTLTGSQKCPVCSNGNHTVDMCTH